MTEGWQNFFKRSLALNRWQADTSRNLALALYNNGNRDKAIFNAQRDLKLEAKLQTSP